MKNAIIVPGSPGRDEYYNPTLTSNSNAHWYPWLSKQLIVKDIHAVVIEPPLPFQPRYDVWKKEFDRFDISPETILVGHSCGGGFLVRYLSEQKDLKVGKVVLVAPWLNPDAVPGSDTADFFDFQIDPDLASRTKGVTIFNSDNDMETIQKSVAILREKVKDIGYKEFHGLSHFCYQAGYDEDLESEEFPELLEECLR
jgi:predicted alpha/beta hydrolase family esterase